MRQIGTLPATDDPRVFADYLLSQGVTTRIIESKAGWDVWVHNEDLVSRGRDELAAYVANPSDPRFHSARSAAEEVRRESARRDRQFRKNFRPMSGSWDRPHLRRRPLTSALVAVCVALFVGQEVSPDFELWLDTHLLFFPLNLGLRPDQLHHGLDAIRQGEVWRLITPALLHANFLHLLFNMWALVVLGTVIEYRRGTRTLAGLSLASALVSNLGQYAYAVYFVHQLHPWVGISGVVYALFGYVWMLGRVELASGMYLHPSSVRIMLLWLILGFTGSMNMANGAHLFGLLTGMAFGIARV